MAQPVQGRAANWSILSSLQPSRAIRPMDRSNTSCSSSRMWRSESPARPLEGADQGRLLMGGGQGRQLQVLTVANQVVLDIVVPNADLRRLVALA